MARVDIVLLKEELVDDLKAVIRPLISPEPNAAYLALRTSDTGFGKS